jgi:hypothetical protein
MTGSTSGAIVPVPSLVIPIWLSKKAAFSAVIIT